jgi:predicted GNAT family acetyltransferase
MAASAELVVTDNTEQSRYEVRQGSEVVGFMTYRLESGRIALIHTEVPPELEGQGIGSELVGRALDDIRRRGLTIAPICPFVDDYLREHPEYADLAARN